MACMPQQHAPSSKPTRQQNDTILHQTMDDAPPPNKDGAGGRGPDPRVRFIPRLHVGVGCWWTCQTESQAKNQAVKPTTESKPHMCVASQIGTSLIDPRWIPQRIPQRMVQGIPQRQRMWSAWICNSLNLGSSHNFKIISEPNVLIWLC